MEKGHPDEKMEVVQLTGAAPRESLMDERDQAEGAVTAWQEWQGFAFVRVRSSVRSSGGFRSNMPFERTPAN
jgi:hypothetical protein